MSKQKKSCQLEERVDVLAEHLSTIRRNTETLISENQRLREVVRLAESELRKRRDQVHQLEAELNDGEGKRQEAKSRVQHAIEKLDQIITAPSEDVT